MLEASSLAGRHALVTGGGTGIGAAIARALHGAGANVTLVGRKRASLDAVAATLSGAHVTSADVTDREQVAAAFASAGTAHGSPDIVVANAGAAESAPFDRLDDAHWQRMIAANLTSVYLTAQAALPHLRAAAHGRLIVVASTAGLKGYGYIAAYAAAKHGAIGLVRALAAELARTDVTVNALCPGFTETAMVEQSVATIVAKTGRTPEAARAELARANPQGRLITPDEVAAAALWLALPSSASITGQAIAIAGGEV